MPHCRDAGTFELSVDFSFTGVMIKKREIINELDECFKSKLGNANESLSIPWSRGTVRSNVRGIEVNRVVLELKVVLRNHTTLTIRSH